MSSYGAGRGLRGKRSGMFSHMTRQMERVKEALSAGCAGYVLESTHGLTVQLEAGGTERGRLPN